MCVYACEMAVTRQPRPKKKEDTKKSVSLFGGEFLLPAAIAYLETVTKRAGRLGDNFWHLEQSRAFLAKKKND